MAEEEEARRQELREQRAALQSGLAPPGQERSSQRTEASDVATTASPSPSPTAELRRVRLSQVLGDADVEESSTLDPAKLEKGHGPSAAPSSAGGASVPTSPAAGGGETKPRRLRGTYKKAETPPQRPAPAPKVKDRRGRLRDAAAVFREEDVRNINKEAGLRTEWPKTHVTKDHESKWNGGHKYMYDNKGMHPNKRSYFDRWLDPRGHNDPPLAGLSPKWRLEPGAVDRDEQDRMRGLLEEYSATCRRGGLRKGDPPAPDGSLAEPQLTRREKRENYRTPWNEPAPVPLWETEEAFYCGEGEEPEEKVDEQAAMEDSQGSEYEEEDDTWRPLPERKLYPGGGGFGDRLDAAHRIGGASPDVIPGDVSFFDAGSKDMAGGGPRGAPSDWDSHHQVTWVNEQTIGKDKKLNPSPLRNYFDRPRNPEIGARSAEVRQTASVQHVDSFDGTSEMRERPVVSRVLPVWRLEPVRGRDTMPDAEELKERKEPLKPRTGWGGASHSTLRGLSTAELSSLGGSLQHTLAGSSATAGSRSAPALGETTESRLPTTASTRRREGQWNGRHHVVFKNEDVSRLDRNYFDRSREPEAMLGPVTAETAQLARSGGVHVWSLEHEGNPADQAAVVTAPGDRRFLPDGRWDYRHHNMFSNRLQANARSYFDRFRDFPDHAADSRKLLELTNGGSVDGPGADSPPGPPARWPTMASTSRTRSKLTEEGRLPVKWKLHEPGRKFQDRVPYEASFRQPVSDGSKVAKKREKRRSAWFSSHNVIF